MNKSFTISESISQININTDKSLRDLLIEFENIMEFFGIPKELNKNDSMIPNTEWDMYYSYFLQLINKQLILIDYFKVV